MMPFQMSVVQKIVLDKIATNMILVLSNHATFCLISYPIQFVMMKLANPLNSH